jgi:hypothetical protein
MDIPSIQTVTQRKKIRRRRLLDQYQRRGQGRSYDTSVELGGFSAYEPLGSVVS